MVDSRKIRAKIIELGLSRSQIAAELNISEHTLHNKISGLTPFKADEAYQLAKMLGVEDDMVPYFFASEVAEIATDTKGGTL